MPHGDILQEASAVATAAGWSVLTTALLDWDRAYQRLERACDACPTDQLAIGAALRHLDAAARDVRTGWELCPAGALPLPLGAPWYDAHRRHPDA